MSRIVSGCVTGWLGRFFSDLETVTWNMNKQENVEENLSRSLFLYVFQALLLKSGDDVVWPKNI